MEALGVRVVLAPAASLATVAYLVAGVSLGTASGLVPGLHVNNLALLLAALAPSVPGPPHLVGVAMLTAGVVHSFLDVVPALALGVPDPAMAATALPGHRLVLAGRGREALRLSALGSAGAVALAVPLALPVSAAMTRLWPVIDAHLPVVLGTVVGGLLVAEPPGRPRRGAALSVAASGLLGLCALDLSPSGLLGTGDVLAPLFAGLFGAPLLIEALGGEGVPPQADARVAAPPSSVAAAGGAGTLAGAIVGYVPGVSSAVAATGALAALPTSSGDRGFVVATSGVNTSNTIFALFAYVTLGTPRTGVMVALETAAVPLNFPLFLAAVGAGGAAGVAVLLSVGDWYLDAVGSLDYTAVSAGVLCLLIVLSVVLAGPLGIGVFAASVVVGSVPAHFGARRVTLMGVLLVPLIVG